MTVTAQFQNNTEHQHTIKTIQLSIWTNTMFDLPKIKLCAVFWFPSDVKGFPSEVYMWVVILVIWANKLDFPLLMCNIHVKANYPWNIIISLCAVVCWSEVRESIHIEKVTKLWTLSVPPLAPPPALKGVFFLKPCSNGSRHLAKKHVILGDILWY